MNEILLNAFRQVPSSRAWVWSLLLCIVTAALEGVLAGSDISARFTDLLQPRLSPPLWLWSLVALAYYTLFFLLLQSILGSTARGASELTALLLIGALLLANASWNWFFFRKRDLELSFFAFVPYLPLATLLAVLLFGMRNRWRTWFLLYLAYLGYATWWMFAVWRLNERHAA